MLRLVHRIVRQYLPDVVIRYRELPAGVMGLSAYLDVPIMFVARGLTPAERAHTILHELAHLLFDRDSNASRRVDRYDWRESRADRFASEMLALHQTRKAA
jgi:Zn-dependent peptidase ImmA (M78 family)